MSSYFMSLNRDEIHCCDILATSPGAVELGCDRSVKISAASAQQKSLSPT